MIVGVLKETRDDERRVALVPNSISVLNKRGVEVWVEAGAGEGAGYPDSDYERSGARLMEDRRAVFDSADLVVQVNGPALNPGHGERDLACLHAGQTLVAQLDPLGDRAALEALAKTGVRAFALELMPRISRAQAMDVLSSMATIAGYKAVLLAAAALPRMFPMLMTAAGTVQAARVFVVGAGVAGLQACATAKRLGAVVQAYDVRPAVREQVQSVGARFVEFELALEAEGQGGYAGEQSEQFLSKQRELMARIVAHSDVVITTAAIPGQRAPQLITSCMVGSMAPGSVIVDLAAERGGNCQPTEPGREVVHKGVRVLGPVNLPSTVPFHASQMLAKNITTFLAHLIAKQGTLHVDTGDEITRETLVVEDRAVVHPRLIASARAVERT